MNEPHRAHQLLQMIDQLHLGDRDPRAEQLAAMAAGNMLSPGLAQMSMHALEELAQQQERVPNLLPRVPDPDELPAFDLTLGSAIEHPTTRLGIELRDRPRHILIAGATGTGKSVLMRRLIEQIDALDIRQLVICRKGDFVDIPQRLGRERWLHLSIHDGLSFGFSPPAMMNDLPKWVGKVLPILGARLRLQHSLSSIGAMMLDAAGPLSRRIGRPVVPNLSMLCDIVAHPGSKWYFGKAQYRESVSQVLNGLRHSAGPLLDALVGLDINAVLASGKSFVLDLTTLADRLTLIVVELLIAQLLWPRVYRRMTVDRTDVVISIDEGDLLASAQATRSYDDEDCPLAALLKQGREFGLMACLAVANLAKVAR